MDKPLMYERGWNKKLSLIIAASHQEVVDVTKRYSTSERLVAARRATMFNEDWLKDVISHLNVTQKMRLSGEQRVGLLSLCMTVYLLNFHKSAVGSPQNLLLKVE